MYKVIAVLFCMGSVSFFQIRKKAIPIKIYNNVQTGANSQFGGLKNGLWIVVNHPSTADEVNRPAIAPTASGIKMEMMNFTIGFMICLTIILKNCSSKQYLNPAKLFIIGDQEARNLIIG